MQLYVEHSDINVQLWILDNISLALQWRHNEGDGVSNHQPHDCLLNRFKGPDHRVLHTLDVTADNSLTGDFRLARPHWNNMARLICNAKFHCKCMGGWFVLKSIAHGSKCPIELCLPIDAGRKFSWLMKTCSEFPLHLRDAANEVIQIAHVHMACDLSRPSTSISPII